MSSSTISPSRLTEQDKALAKLAMLVDQAEKIFFEGYAKQGVEFALSEPLWLTWTLETFGKSSSWS